MNGRPRWFGLAAAVIGVSLAWGGVARGGLFDDSPGSTSTPPARPADPVPPPAPRPTPEPPAPPPVAPKPTTRPAAKVNSATQPARAPSPPPRRPVPTDAQLKSAEQEVKEVFGPQIGRAHTSIERTALLSKLIDTARTTEDPASQFALIRNAESLGVLANNLDATLAARGWLRRWFELGNSRAATDLYQQLAPKAQSAPEAQKLCDSILLAADDAMEGDHFEVARQLAQLAQPLARRSGDTELPGRVTAVAGRATACEVEQRRIAPAEAVLKTKPDDPAANAAVGHYLCLTKGDWTRGLPMLAKGNDAALKSLATRELTAPSAAKDQAELADGWWALVDSEPATVRATIRTHAGQWYAAAAGALTGLDKLKAEQRSGDYLKLKAPAPAPAVAADGAPGWATYDGPLAMLRAIPSSLFPSTLVEWDDEHRTAVNTALKQTVVDHPGTFTIVVAHVEPHSDPSPMMTINRPVKLGQFTAQVNTVFDPAHKDQWNAIREGSTYAVTGRIATAYFDGTQLLAYVTDCRLMTADEVARAAGPKPNPAESGRRPRAVVPNLGKADFASVQDVLDAVPIDLMPKAREEWRDKELNSRFAKAYQEAFRSKSASCRVTIARRQTVGDNVMIYSDTFPIPGTNSKLSFYASVPASDPRLATIHAGDACYMTGSISGMGWGPGGLNLGLRNCQFTPAR